MLAVMTVAVKVDVAAAAAAAAAVGMLATILVLLVASLPFTCLLQQLEPTLSWNSSFSKRKKRQKNSPLGNRRLKSALVFTKMFKIITSTPRSNFSKMRDHRKAQAPRGNLMRPQHLYKSVFTKALLTNQRTDRPMDSLLQKFVYKRFIRGVLPWFLIYIVMVNQFVYICHSQCAERHIMNVTVVTL